MQYNKLPILTSISIQLNKSSGESKENNNTKQTTSYSKFKRQSRREQYILNEY